MKKILLNFSFIVALFCIASCKKDIIKKVPESKSYSISSQHMQKDYTIYVLYPDDFDSSLTYRTLVLLDANDYFIEMAEVIQNDFPNQFVFVGVMYNQFSERVEDFTYPTIPQTPSSGHADQYIQFLGDELLPYLRNNLNIKSSDKTLLGHSLTGYLGTYLLFQQDYENPFDNIISASPSLWWSNGYAFGLEEKYAAVHTSLDTKYFITIGDLEGAMMNTYFNAFVKKIESRNYNTTAFQAKRYDKTSHRNSPIVSFRDGLKFIQ